MAGKKQDLNFELDLIPIISVLAITICFLLAVAVWLPIGTVNMQQALGEKSTGAVDNPPTVFAAMQGNGDIKLTLKDLDEAQKREQDVIVSGEGGKIAWAQLESALISIKQEHPQVKNAVVLPNQASKYDDVIQVMDKLKTAQINEVGISPF